MNNKYYYHSRISEKKFRQLVQCFADDIDAKQTSALINLNRRTVTNIFRKTRSRLVEDCQKKFSVYLNGFSTIREYILSEMGKIEVKQEDHGEDNLTAVLGIMLKNEGFDVRMHEQVYEQAYSEIISFPETTMFNDSTHILEKLNFQYDFGFVNFRLAKIPDIYNGDSMKRQFFDKNHIYSFWQFSKLRLKKFNGLKSDMFNLHLKECEWRFNNNSKNLYSELLKMLRENPLDKSF